MRAVIYCRVSTKEQTTNLSLPTQRERCLEYCCANGMDVDRVFVEGGESAKTTARTEFQKLLSYCHDSRKTIDCLVVYALSRFARSTPDHYAVRVLLQKLGITLRSVTEPIDDSASGKLMEGVLASFAQFDNDVRSERTSAGMKAALERGRWTFQPPVGYIKPSTQREGSPSLLPDPERSGAIAEAFQMRANGGCSQTEILRHLSAVGFRTRNGATLSSTALSKILRNPIYCGVVSVPKWGIRCEGDFVPIVTQSVFNKVQRRLDGRTHSGTTYKIGNPDFPLRGFVRCSECGRRVTGSWSKGRGGKYAYYRCFNPDCRSLNVRKERLEEEFVLLLREITPKEGTLRLFTEIVLEVWNAQLKDRDMERKTLLKTLDRLRDRKRRLVEALLYDRISQADYDEENAQILASVADAECELAFRFEPEGGDIEGQLEAACAVLRAPDETWNRLPNEARARFQGLLFPSGIEFDGKGFGTAATSPVFGMLQAAAVDEGSLASLDGASLNQLREWLKGMRHIRELRIPSTSGWNAR